MPLLCMIPSFLLLVKLGSEFERAGLEPGAGSGLPEEDIFSFTRPPRLLGQALQEGALSKPGGVRINSDGIRIFMCRDASISA